MKKSCEVCTHEIKYRLKPGSQNNHNGCFYYPKLFVQCPNILASIYAQKRLSEEFGFKILGGTAHFSDRFVVVGPPAELKEDKPLIVSGESADINEDWMNLFEALSLFSLTENMKKYSSPK